MRRSGFNNPPKIQNAGNHANGHHHHNHHHIENGHNSQQFQLQQHPHNSHHNGHNGHLANSRRRTMSASETEQQSHNVRQQKQNQLKLNALRNNSIAKMSKTLNQYRKSSTLCDFELRVGDQVYPVHKAVLAAASSYFEAMLANGAENFVENSNNYAQLQDIEPDTCELLLHYIYTGEISVNKQNVQDIARAANMFELIELCEYCANFLLECITTSNCIGILCFADFYGFSQLCFNAKRFVEQRFAEVCREREFLNLPASLLRGFLRSENLSIDSEYQVLECTLKWVLKDPAERGQHLEEFINLIRMPLIPSELVYELSQRWTNCDIRHLLEPYLVQNGNATDENNDQTLEVNVNNSYNAIRKQPRMCSRKKVFVLGGVYFRGSEPYTLNTMDSLNLHTRTWKKEVPFLYPRNSHCVVQLANKLYLIGGQCDSLVLDTMEVYDLGTKNAQDRWSNGARLQYPRSSFAACALNNKIYAFGGKGPNASCSIECYNLATNEWTFHSNLPLSLESMQVMVRDNQIYIIGGKTCQRTLDTLICYNPVSGDFNYLAPMNTARSDFGCTLLHGTLYVIGGVNSEGVSLSTVEQYNFAENKWSYVAPMDKRRSAFQAVSINNMIYVFGGRQNNSHLILKSVDVYDPSTDQWLATNPMPSNRSDAAVVLV